MGLIERPENTPERRFWHVRAHVAVRGVGGDEAAELAREEVAGVTRDDGNWTLAVVGATSVGPVDAEEEPTGEEQVAVTLETEADTAQAAVSSVEYWLDGLWGRDVRMLFVDPHAEQTPAPAGAAARTFEQLAELLGGQPDPYGESIVVDGVPVRLSLLDRHLNGRPVVQLYSIDLDEDQRGSGLGTRTVQALRAAADEIGADVVVGPITNAGFWDRFNWLHDVDVSYLDVGGGYMSSSDVELEDRQAGMIRFW